MTEKIANNSSSSAKKAPKAAAAVALSAMIAFNVCPVEAFTPSFLVPSPRMMMHRGPSFSSTLAPAATITMDCTPWDMECYGVHPFGGPGGLQRRRQMHQRRRGPMIFAPEDLFQGPAVQPQQEFAISDPTVAQDTNDLYALTFDVPAGVDHDGLEVSVSERLLTVTARVTREDGAGPSSRRGGWATRSSRTDSVSRSFVLPEGLSTSSAAASLLSDGKAEVKFVKEQPVTKAAAAPASSAQTDTPPSTAAPDTPAASSAAEAPASGTERPASLSDSPFDLLDEEFREFAKARWGEEVLELLQVPTQEELAEKAAAAREKREAVFAERVKAGKEARAKWEAEFAEKAKAAKEARAKREAEFAERVAAAKETRAKRVVAMKRATMASDVSGAEDGSSYVVRVALPEGVTRNNVKLTANPNRSLRITVSTSAEESGRSIYKDVFLPKDALIEEISAKFEAEQQDEMESNKEDGVGEGTTVASNVVGAGAVSGLEVTVGRAAPPQPKTIDIL